MIRFLTIAVLLAGAAPAIAQTCKITRKEGGLESFASASINGTAATSVRYGQGPRLVDLKIDPAAKAAGYTFKDNGKVGFYVYRSGKSVEGKDWMQAGSIATEMSVFEIDWPRFFLKKDMVKSVGIELAMEGMAERDIVTKHKEGQARDGFMKPLDFGASSPRDLYWFSEGLDEDEELAIEDSWVAAIRPGKQMTVDFYDATKNFYNNKLPRVKLATATVTFPTDEDFQSRYIADFTALRKAFTEKRCDAPK